MPAVVAVYVLAELTVAVPVDVVCQYQVSPAGAEPFAVIVTPGEEHCGELLVGVPGLAGKAFTVMVTSFEIVDEPHVGVEVHTK